MAKEKIPAYIGPEDMERLRDAVVWLQKHAEDTPYSLSSFCTEAVMRAVKDAETKYMRGRPFPPRRRQLASGPRPATNDPLPGPEDDCGV